MPPAKHTEEQVKEALVKCAGVLLHAAKALGVDRTSLTRRIKKNPDLKEHHERCREVNIDIAESQLFELIRNGQANAIIFYLKCQAKHRGYVERLEQTGKDGKDLALPIHSPPRATSMEEWLEQNRSEAAA